MKVGDRALLLEGLLIASRRVLQPMRERYSLEMAFSVDDTALMRDLLLLPGFPLTKSWMSKELGFGSDSRVVDRVLWKHLRVKLRNPRVEEKVWGNCIHASHDDQLDEDSTLCADADHFIGPMTLEDPIEIFDAGLAHLGKDINPAPEVGGTSMSDFTKEIILPNWDSLKWPVPQVFVGASCPFGSPGRILLGPNAVELQGWRPSRADWADRQSEREQYVRLVQKTHELIWKLEEKDRILSDAIRDCEGLRVRIGELTGALFAIHYSAC
jgi:hypothetical protein